MDSSEYTKLPNSTFVFSVSFSSATIQPAPYTDSMPDAASSTPDAASSTPDAASLIHDMEPPDAATHPSSTATVTAISSIVLTSRKISKTPSGNASSLKKRWTQKEIGALHAIINATKNGYVSKKIIGQYPILKERSAHSIKSKINKLKYGTKQERKKYGFGPIKPQIIWSPAEHSAIQTIWTNIPATQKINDKFKIKMAQKLKKLSGSGIQRTPDAIMAYIKRNLQ